MKKIKIFAAAILFCGASLLGYNAYSNATMTPEERLTQANIEALTDGEIYDGLKSKTEKCPDNTTRVYCVTGRGRCLVQNCQ